MKPPKRISDEDFDRALGLFREPSAVQVESSKEKVLQMIESASTDSRAAGALPGLDDLYSPRTLWKFVSKPILVAVVLVCLVFACLLFIIPWRNSHWIFGGHQVQGDLSLLEQSNQGLSKTEQIPTPLPQGDGGSPVARGNPFVVLQPETFVAGAWWQNSSLTTRMGLTNEQKMTLGASFESRRGQLTDMTTLLDEQEDHFYQLLEQDDVDTNAVMGQIDRVIQVETDLERQTAAMMLEMRRAVSKSQWLQVGRRSLVSRYHLFPQNADSTGRGGRRAVPSPETPSRR